MQTHLQLVFQSQAVLLKTHLPFRSTFLQQVLTNVSVGRIPRDKLLVLLVDIIITFVNHCNLCNGQKIAIKAAVIARLRDTLQSLDFM
jgi:hypothetical protein